MSAVEKVLGALKNSPQPLKAGEIVELTGLDKKDVDKALKELKNEDRINSPKRCFYAVTE